MEHDAKNTLTWEDAIAREIVDGAACVAHFADLGNLNKQVDAVERQINAFSVIRDTIGTDGLDKTLVDVMEAREKYREDTLSELAERLNITKSCLNHRLRKIMTIADNLK